MRTCAGCGQRRPQSRLVRLSAGSDGTLAIGRGPGRGVYLCPDRTCVERALRSGALPRRLRTPVRIPDDPAALLPEGENGLTDRIPG